MSTQITKPSLSDCHPPPIGLERWRCCGKLIEIFSLPNPLQQIVVSCWGASLFVYFGEINYDRTVKQCGSNNNHSPSLMSFDCLNSSTLCVHFYGNKIRFFICLYYLKKIKFWKIFEEKTISNFFTNWRQTLHKKSF